MKKLIIVGAGGFGREVAEWARQNPAYGTYWEIEGFIDDNLNALNGFSSELKIIESIKNWQPGKDHLHVIAIGNTKTKKAIVEGLISKGAKFISLIHPTVIIASSAEIGIGSVICPFSVISANAKIGKYVIINLNCAIGHDAKIEDWCTLSSFCDVTGKVKIGSGTYMGSHAAVVPKVRVGCDVNIGAGSIVVTNIKDNSRVFGIPARRLSI